MKPILTIFSVLYSISICTASCSKGEIAPTQNNGVETNNAIATKMKITIGTAVFTATLYDNPSANALKAMLPLTVNMNELNSNEKYYDLPNRLPADASVGSAINAGDLMLYGNNVLVLFYKNFNSSYSYTKLGYVDNSTGLAAALGNRNVIVKLESN